MKAITINGKVLRVIEFSAPNVVAWLGFLAFMSLTCQLILGASVLVIVVVAVTIGLGLGCFLLVGIQNAGAWLLLFYVAGNVLIALYAKTLFGQPLDSHLYEPLESFFVLLISTAFLAFALLLVSRLPLGAPLLKPVVDTRLLTRISWTSFLFGVLAWFLNQHFQGPDGSGFGGFAALRSLLLMAVIARTALLLERSGDRTSIDTTLALMLAVGVILGLLSNTKTETVLPVISYLVTLLFYRGRIGRKQLLSVGLVLFLFAALVAPLIHVWRAAGFQQMTFADRIEFLQQSIGDFFRTGRISELQDESRSLVTIGYYDYYGNDGDQQMFVGRYTSVQQIDPVIWAANSYGFLGMGLIWPSITVHLPRLLNPDKSEYPQAYITLTRYGLIDPDGGKFFTLPLAGQAYAADGLWGVVVVSAFTFLVFLMVYKKLGWNLRRNIYAIFFYCDFIIVYANQGSLDQYAGAALRNFPLFFVIFASIEFLGPGRTRYRLH